MRDTDSLDPGAIREKYVTTQELLQWASGGAPFKVILCIPELESVFFAARDILDRIFPKRIFRLSEMFYPKQPKEALAHCFAQGGGPTTLLQLLDALTDDDTKRLQAIGPIRELSDFVEEVVNPVGKAEAV